MYSSMMSIVLSLTRMSFSAFWSINLNSYIENSLFTFALFFICFAREPNLSVDLVSSSLKVDGEQVMIKDVIEFPPRDS